MTFWTIITFVYDAAIVVYYEVLMEKTIRIRTRDLLKENGRHPSFKQHTYLVSDSKGASVRRFFPKIPNFHILQKAGTSASDKSFTKFVTDEIRNRKKPVIIIWFGTCELTVKEGRELKLREPPFQNVEDRIRDNTKFKKELLRANKDAIIVFLECPYYSTKKYNNRSLAKGQKEQVDTNNNIPTKSQRVDKSNKGHASTRSVSTSNDKNKKLKVTIKGTTQREIRKQKGKDLQITIKGNKGRSEPLYDSPRLSKAVDYYNTQIRKLNDIETPIIANDIVKAHKRKSFRYTKYKKDFSLLHDGVHPNRLLAKLWAEKVIKVGLDLNAFCE